MGQAVSQVETFRDPAGSLSISGDSVLRRVRPRHARAALEFLPSDLARQWVAQGRLVDSRFLPSTEDETLLQHPRIFFPTYPWEWTPGAWIAAAELTLDLCDALLDRGLILKDATPLNILFQGPQPVFVDVLSIDARDPRSPIWLAYGQFVRTFLLPLAANKYLGWPLSASVQKRDGYEPADLAPYLGSFRKWREPFRSLVALPLMLEKNGAQAAQKTAHIRRQPQVALRVLRRNLAALRARLAGLDPRSGDSRWSRYTQTADHYSAGDRSRKQQFVREALASARPRHILDLGANTGVYSRIAAEQGAQVVAWDTDIQALEQNRAEAARLQLPIVTAVANPARPTPAVGWRNAESLSLLDRARGRFDCVLMLGLIHHLLLADQIPLPAVAALLRDLTTHWAIVEWVPAKDPRFQDLLRGRDGLYAHLDEAAFLAAAQNHFSVVLREALPNGRVLFLLQAR